MCVHKKSRIVTKWLLITFNYILSNLIPHWMKAQKKVFLSMKNSFRLFCKFSSFATSTSIHTWHGWKRNERGVEGMRKASMSFELSSLFLLLLWFYEKWRLIKNPSDDDKEKFLNFFFKKILINENFAYLTQHYPSLVKYLQ